MIILVKGEKNTSNYAERILSALAVVSAMTYGKKTLILQTTTDTPVEKILRGKLDSYTIKNRYDDFNFDDTGLDAILRREAMGPLSAEQFTDYCYAMFKQANNLDVAGVSKNENIAEYLMENITLFKELLKNAETVYDNIFILADAGKQDFLDFIMEEDIYDREVMCISQGPLKEKGSQNTFYAVKNFDALSIYTIKQMSQSYNSKRIFPIPYNIGFKDACLSESALMFLASNINPDEADDNAFFMASVSNFISALIGMDEPEIKDKKLVFKKIFKKDRLPLDTVIKNTEHSLSGNDDYDNTETEAGSKKTGCSKKWFEKNKKRMPEQEQLLQEEISSESMFE